MSIRSRYLAYRKLKGYSYAASLLIKGQFDFYALLESDNAFLEGVQEANRDFRNLAQDLIEIGKSREKYDKQRHS